ncbi:MAG TPA: histidinol-phosphate transaminase [Opitutaceae bacterium]
MKPSELAKPFVLTYPAYVPGRPIDDVAREMNLDPSAVIKMASNENALGPSPRAAKAAAEAISRGQLYPDGGCQELRAKLARVHGLLPGQFVIGNGSNEVIELIGHVFLNPGDEVVMGRPEFVVYKLVSVLFGARAVEVPFVNHRNNLAGLRRAVTGRTKLVIVATPNNPVGTANPSAEVAAFIRSLPASVICVVDEAYSEFASDPVDLRPLIAEGRNVIGLRTFSKVYGLAALRVGYGYSGAEMASLVDRVRQPFNVNAVAQAAASAALDDADFARRSVAEARKGLRRLAEGFASQGVEFVPSEANFMLARVGNGARVAEALQRRGVIVRPVDNYGMPEWIRVTAGTAEQNERFLSELSAVLR